MRPIRARRRPSAALPMALVAGVVSVSWTLRGAVAQPAATPLTEHEIEVPLAPAPAPVPPAASAIQIGQTYLLASGADASVNAAAWPLAAPAGDAGSGVFVPASVTPLSIEQTQGEAGALTVAWTLALGAAVAPDGSLTPCGVLRADVQSTLTGSCATFAAISPLPLNLAQAVQEGITQSALTPTPENPDPTIRFCLGSSCSCPRCANGMFFAAPFFIIGVCDRIGGIDCCARACSAACVAHATGMEPADAWIQGQGMFVICMIAQASQ